MMQALRFAFLSPTAQKSLDVVTINQARIAKGS